MPSFEHSEKIKEIIIEDELFIRFPFCLIERHSFNQISLDELISGSPTQ